MTAEEVLQKGEYHGQAYFEVDGLTNVWEGQVYDVDGVLYLVEYCNRRLLNGEPIKMRAEEVTTYEYEPI